MKKSKMIASRLVTLALTLALLTTTALADGIAESELGVGVKNLFSDLTKYLMILSPIAGGAAAGYCVIRRGMANEQDGAVWEKRAKIAVACGVGGTLVGGIIRLISSYF